MRVNLLENLPLDRVDHELHCNLGLVGQLHLNLVNATSTTLYNPYGQTLLYIEALNCHFLQFLAPNMIQDQLKIPGSRNRQFLTISGPVNCTILKIYDFRVETISQSGRNVHFFWLGFSKVISLIVRPRIQQTRRRHGSHHHQKCLIQKKYLICADRTLV